MLSQIYNVSDIKRQYNILIIPTHKFLNENFKVDKWVTELSDDMLNHEVYYGILENITFESAKKFFIRPLEDNKAFDGMVIDMDLLNHWRNDQSKKGLMNLEVVVSPVKNVYREYRIFVVKNEVITGSLYRVSGKPQISDEVGRDVIDYVYTVINKWVPIESFVIDIALTDDGYKVIEFNNINSSGFYACNVPKYVEAIQLAYA